MGTNVLFSRGSILGGTYRDGYVFNPNPPVQTKYEPVNLADGHIDSHSRGGRKGERTYAQTSPAFSGNFKHSAYCKCLPH